MTARSIYFVGASVTAQKGGWAHRFAASASVEFGVEFCKVINAVGGTDIIFGAANHAAFIEQINATPPQLAFIEYSTGDLNFRRQPNLIEPFLRALVLDLKGRGICTYFVNLYRSDCVGEDFEPWREIYRKVGAELGVKTIDLYRGFEADIELHPALQQHWYRDNVHSTEEGSIKIASEILSAVRDDFSLCQNDFIAPKDYPVRIDFLPREKDGDFVYRNTDQCFGWASFQGAPLFSFVANSEIHGIVIITGPRSGFLDLCVDGVVQGVYRGFDHNSYYERPMPIIFKRPIHAGSVMTLSLSTSRQPDFNECKIAHVDFSAPREIKMVGFIASEFGLENNMQVDVLDAVKTLRALRLDKKFAEGISYYIQIQGGGIESLELTYEYLSCLYFSNQIGEATDVAQRLLKFEGLAPHHYVLCLKTFSRSYRYDLLSPVVAKIPEKTLPELQAVIDGAATVSSFLQSSDSLLSEGMISSKEVFSTNDLIEYLMGVIREKSPTSFVRLRDGEGCLIGAALHSGPAVKAWSQHFFDLQFGRSFVESSNYSDGRTKITRLLLDAVSDADVIGVLKAPQLKRLQESYAGPIQVAGNYYNYLYLSRNKIHAKRIVDSCVHYDPAFVKFVRDFLMSEEFPLGIIGPHDSVARAVASRRGVDLVYHQTPPESRYFPDGAKNHYPDIFKKIAKALKKGSAGRVYFVGAGLLGKVYCNIIKQNGGIAIDVGSLMDLFAGHLHTRSPLGRLKNANELLITEETVASGR